MQPLLTPKAAGIFLGVSPTMLKEMRLRGDGPAYVPVSERKIRYRQEDLDAWIQLRLVKGGGRVGA